MVNIEKDENNYIISGSFSGTVGELCQLIETHCKVFN